MAHILGDEDRAPFAYDGNANALYYRLTREPVARTIDIDGRVMVDVDASGKVIGIEVLDPPGFSASVSTRTSTTVGAAAYWAQSTVVDYIAKGHLGTPCPKPREGGLCGCDEDDLATPRDCYQGRCSC